MILPPIILVLMELFHSRRLPLREMNIRPNSDYPSLYPNVPLASDPYTEVRESLDRGCINIGSGSLTSKSRGDQWDPEEAKAAYKHDDIRDLAGNVERKECDTPLLQRSGKKMSVLCRGTASGKTSC